ncbi:MAG: glycosyltransferase family 2 protein [Planctomycetes bacterium]|nr:glycosyltransferase family 2 protein [Planctomycetota bacterium]
MTVALSVVIPVHNEAENVGPLHGELLAALGPLDLATEVISVDDGSGDGTFARLRELHAEKGGPLSVRVVRFRRRFGKAAALAAGFERARGGTVITMDGDLQDDPREIPRFLEKLGEGLDLVSGWKRRRRDPASKTLPSRLFNAVLSRLTGIRLHDFNCGFKAYRGELARRLRPYGGLYRYIPVFAHAMGYRVGELEVQHRPRTRGRSKFGVARLVTGFLDLWTVLMLTRCAWRPMHLFGAMGLLAWLGAAAAVIGGLFARGAGAVWALAAVVLLVAGLQCFGMGLLAELLVWARHDAEKGTFSFSAQRPSAPQGGEKVNVPFSAYEVAEELGAPAGAASDGEGA